MLKELDMVKKRFFLGGGGSGPRRNNSNLKVHWEKENNIQKK